jgi:CIC family chloride channel protein
VRWISKYLKTPQLRTREPLFRYVEKWVLLSSLLGLLTGAIVALFDYVTTLTLWTFFSSLFSQNPLMIIPCVLFALFAIAFLLSKSATQVGSGTEEVVKAYNDPDGKIDMRPFPQKMLAAIVTIGLGGSAGQEGPSVYVWWRDRIVDVEQTSKC